MAAIQITTFLPSPVQLSSEESSPNSGPTEQTSACPSGSRTSSDVDPGSAPPPRYSGLRGALPPMQPGTDTTASIMQWAAAVADPDLVTDADGSPTLPPLYSSIFQTKSRADRERHHERRRSRFSQGGSISIREHKHRNGEPSSSSPQLYEYHLRNGKTQPWASLKVYSRYSASSLAASESASSAQRIPKYTTGQLISGSLDLNLEAPLNVNSMNLSLRGRIITSSYEGGSYTFLEQPIISWTRNNGDPCLLPLCPSHGQKDEIATGSSRSTKKFEGKLSGNYSWPFSLPFPKETSVATSVNQAATSRSRDHSPSSVVYPIPQTFSERDTKGSVQYELVLRMSHGLLRSDSKIYVPVVYVPDITPSSASALRQLAYTQRTRVPGPDIDPLGWNTLAPVTVRGKLYAERSVKLRCTLSLANPQSYTRGTVIPCDISIESSDTQALDVLASPKAIAVRLIRRLQYYEEGGGIQTLSVSQGKQKMIVSSPVGAVDGRGGPKRMVTDTAEMERAVWWVNPDAGEQAPKRRRLEGEIHLKKDLQPSCPFSLFKVSYAVELFPFETPVFSAPDSSPLLRNIDAAPPKALISHSVIIATLPGEGAATIPFTMPKHRSLSKKPSKRYLSK